MSKILLIHGPNLNLLGSREPLIYGNTTLEKINQKIQEWGQIYKISIEIHQSNHEGEIVDIIGQAKNMFDILIINPAAYTHTSIAIRDAISAIEIPVIEVHLSNIYKREKFRHTSMISAVSCGQISGFGEDSYILALEAALIILKRANAYDKTKN